MVRSAAAEAAAHRGSQPACHPPCRSHLRRAGTRPMPAGGRTVCLFVRVWRRANPGTQSSVQAQRISARADGAASVTGGHHAEAITIRTNPFQSAGTTRGLHLGAPRRRETCSKRQTTAACGLNGLPPGSRAARRRRRQGSVEGTVRVLWPRRDWGTLVLRLNTARTAVSSSPGNAAGFRSENSCLSLLQWSSFTCPDKPPQPH